MFVRNISSPCKRTNSSLYICNNVTFLRYSKTIRSAIAFFLLLVFVFGNAPKIFLHDAFANHTDVVSTCKHTNGVCLHQQGYNCHIDNLVVNAHYIFKPVVFAALLPLLFKSYFPPLLASFNSSRPSGTENKGPPSIA